MSNSEKNAFLISFILQIISRRHGHSYRSNIIEGNCVLRVNGIGKGRSKRKSTVASLRTQTVIVSTL